MVRQLERPDEYQLEVSETRLMRHSNARRDEVVQFGFQRDIDTTIGAYQQMSRYGRDPIRFIDPTLYRAVVNEHEDRVSQLASGKCKKRYLFQYEYDEIPEGFEAVTRGEDQFPGFDVKSKLQDLMQEFGLKPIPGVTNWYLYCNSEGSMFAIHVEDGNLLSINIHISGSPKYWVMIPAECQETVRSFLREFYDSDTECEDPTRHKDLYIPLYVLVERGIPFRIVPQEPGQIIITLPGVYHQGWNSGPGFSVAQNISADFGFPRMRDASWCSCESGQSPQIPLPIIAAHESPESLDRLRDLKVKCVEARRVLSSLPNHQATSVRSLLLRESHYEFHHLLRRTGRERHPRSRSLISPYRGLGDNRILCPRCWDLCPPKHKCAKFRCPVCRRAYPKRILLVKHLVKRRKCARKKSDVEKDLEASYSRPHEGQPPSSRQWELLRDRGMQTEPQTSDCGVQTEAQSGDQEKVDERPRARRHHRFSEVSGERNESLKVAIPVREVEQRAPRRPLMCRSLKYPCRVSRYNPFRLPWGAQLANKLQALRRVMDGDERAERASTSFLPIEAVESRVEISDTENETSSGSSSPDPEVQVIAEVKGCARRSRLPLQFPAAAPEVNYDSLAPRAWVSGDTIDAWSELLFRESQVAGTRPPIRYVSYGLSDILSGELGDPNPQTFDDFVQQNTRRVRVFEDDSVFFMPIIASRCHWVLLVVDNRTRNISLLNSMPEHFPIVLPAIDMWLQAQHRHERRRELWDSGYTGAVPHSLPIQPNLFDCGVYVMRWMDRIVRGLSLRFEHSDEYREALRQDLIHRRLRATRDPMFDS